MVHPFPEADDVAAGCRGRGEIGARDRAHPRPAPLARPRRRPGRQVLAARATAEQPHELVGRLARIELRGRRRRGRSRKWEGSSCSRPTGSTPTRSGPDRRAPREAPLRGRARRGQARNEKFISQRPRRGRRRGAQRSSTATAPSSKSWAEHRPPKRSSARASRSAGASGWSACAGSARCSACRSTASPRSTSSAPTARPLSPAMTAALLDAHGVSAGAYVSPHLISWRERIVIGGRADRRGGVRPGASSEPRRRRGSPTARRAKTGR